MFRILARLVQRRSWLVVLAWAGLTYLLFHYAPLWEQVTKDDDVRFFPRDFPSVIGQDLLERGFPLDAASSQVVSWSIKRRPSPMSSRSSKSSRRSMTSRR